MELVQNPRLNLVIINCDLDIDPCVQHIVSRPNFNSVIDGADSQFKTFNCDLDI